jgi:osmoprotectant transport system permease protein
VITAFSSDGRIAANDLIVLADPRGAILPYDAVILVAAKRSADPLLRRALTPLVDAIPVALMREANYRVDRKDEPEDPVTAARWLANRALAPSQ